LTTRRDARRLAIDVLYQSDITSVAPREVLVSWVDAGRDIPVFSRELVEGVAEHQPEIDLLLEEHAQSWTVARMTALDRTILRVAVEELLYRPDVPTSAAISEAVEAAAELSAEESRGFVNGVLGPIARELRGTEAES
jgi:transcription antitermination protein NusB